MRRISILLICVAALAGASVAVAAGHRAKVKLASTSLGKILVNGRGFTVYMFTADRRGKDNCVKMTDCTSVWPPLTTTGRAQAGPDVRRALLSTIKLPSGAKQVTYAGHPLYTYSGDVGWSGLNLLVSLASVVFAAGTLLTLWNIGRSLRHGEPAGADPWGADSLEWATTSPPPDHNFDATPIVASRHPLWDQRPLPVARSGPDAATRALGRGGAVDRAAALTGGLRAEPEAEFPIPEESVLPLVLALGIAAVFVGLLVKIALVGVVGVAIGAIALLTWAWRTGEEPT